MKKLISIIIPVYNVEKYIEKCLDSILRQTYSNFEVLLVDDGSTDDSGKICDKYKKDDNRFKVFHQNNSGVSSARNKALKEIKGDLVCFIDPDDYVSDDYLEFLYSNLVKYDADISMCFRHIFYEDDINGNANTSSNVDVYENNQILLLHTLKSSHSFAMKLFKKELFNGLVFPNLKKAEDSYLMFDILEKKPKIVFDSAEKYFYLERKNGATKTINLNQLDYISAYQHWTDKSKIIYGIESKEYYLNCISLLDSIIGNLSTVHRLIDINLEKKYINIFEEYYKTIKIKDLKKNIKYFLFRKMRFIIFLLKG